MAMFLFRGGACRGYGRYIDLKARGGADRVIILGAECLTSISVDGVRHIL